MADQNERPEYKPRHIIGRLHTYAGMKRDAIIIVALGLALLLINLVGG